MASDNIEAHILMLIAASSNPDSAIAHCLGTIRNADRIYVLENGRIAQEGSFTQLAQQKGLFAQLIARQTL
jgi:ABC-type multidrug transport system fused ATPase/permease subunit